MKLIIPAFLIIALTLATGFSEQVTDDIPPPVVAESTPIPIPSATPIPAPTGALMIKPEMRDLIVTFRVRNMNTALDFYTGKLGFRIIFQDGKNYTAVGRDAVQIGLILDKKTPRAGFGSSYIITSEVAMLCDEMKKRNVQLTDSLTTKPSKMQEFSVKDPDSNLLIFGEYTGTQ